MRFRKIVKFATIAILGAAAALGIAFISFRPSAMPSPLHKVAMVTSPQLTYAWLDNHNLVASWDVPTSAEKYSVGSYPMVSKSELVDTSSGQITDLAPLGSGPEDNCTFLFSSDRRYAIWQDDDDSLWPGPPSVVITGLSLPRRNGMNAAVPVDAYGQGSDGIFMAAPHNSDLGAGGPDDEFGPFSYMKMARWDPKRDRWAEIMPRDLTNSSSFLMKFGGPNIKATDTVTIASPVDVSSSAMQSIRFLGIASDGTVIVYTQANTSLIDSALIEIKWGRKIQVMKYHPPIAQSFSLPFGFGYSCWDIALSPDGTRIAWLCPYNPPPRVETWLEAVKNFVYGSRTEPDSALWISDTTCHGVRRIAEWTRGSSGDLNLQWTPDSKRITFDQVTQSTNSNIEVARLVPLNGQPKRAMPVYDTDTYVQGRQWNHSIYTVDVP